MAPRVAHRTVRDDRVLPATRIVAVAIIPFLVVAFVDLYFWPDETDRFFAWPIKPTVTPLILGSVYLGGSYFFLRAARSTQWHTIKAGFPPVATFATLMGIATIIHWDKFNHAHVAFWLWAGLYFTTPILVFGVWLRNRRYEDLTKRVEPSVTTALAAIVGAIGLLAAAMSLFLFVFPARAIEVWPWLLTPLTARAMGAIFALGLAAVGAFTERRWGALRLMVQVEVFMLILILIGAIRAAGDFDSGNALTWVFGVGFVGVLVSSVLLYVRMETPGR